MAIAAALYAVSLGVVALIERASSSPDTAAEETAPASPHTHNALSLVAHDRYLLLIGALLIIANLVNTQGEYILANTVRGHAELFPAPERGAVIGRFYGAF